MKKIGLVLSGCGVYDGSEIHEAVALLIALEKAGCECCCFAPDIAQRDVVDHAAGSPARESRNVLVESARIARGAIRPLADLDPAALDGLAFPGGFGAVKNLSDFAVAGERMTVLPAVEKALLAANRRGLPILAVCIAPALVAKVFGDRGVRFTIGNDPGTAKTLAAFGGTHVGTDERGVVVDEKLGIVTAPAYMLAASPAAVFDNITAAVAAFVRLIP